MNLRLYSMALLISAIPSFALAGADISLNREDFIAAERVNPEGDTVLKVKLSKSGKAKFKRLNQQIFAEQPNQVHAEVAGVTTNFKLRAPIKSDKLEMGPYSSAEADRVAAEINK